MAVALVGTMEMAPSSTKQPNLTIADESLLTAWDIFLVGLF
jgi:hypothetical protein